MCLDFAMFFSCSGSKAGVGLLHGWIWNRIPEVNCCELEFYDFY